MVDARARGRGREKLFLVYYAVPNEDVITGQKAVQVAQDRGWRHHHPEVVLDVPADRLRAGVIACRGKAAPQLDDQLDRPGRRRTR